MFSAISTEGLSQAVTGDLIWSTIQYMAETLNLQRFSAAKQVSLKEQLII